jgi:hypothetical protein
MRKEYWQTRDNSFIEISEMSDNYLLRLYEDNKCSVLKNELERRKLIPLEEIMDLKEQGYINTGIKIDE